MTQHYNALQLLESKFSKIFPVQQLDSGDVFRKMRYSYDNSQNTDSRTIHLELISERPQYNPAFEALVYDSEKTVEEKIQSLFDQEVHRVCSTVPVAETAPLDDKIVFAMRRWCAYIARDTRRGMGNRIIMNSATLSLVESVINPKCMSESFIEDTAFKSITDIPVITCDSLPLDEIVMTYIGNKHAGVSFIGTTDGGIFFSFKSDRIIYRDELHEEEHGLQISMAVSIDEHSKNYYAKIKLA